MIKISPRTGRPKVDNPKSVDIKVRIDDQTHNELLEYCKKNSLTKAEAIRKGLKLLFKK